MIDQQEKEIERQDGSKFECLHDKHNERQVDNSNYVLHTISEHLMKNNEKKNETNSCELNGSFVTVPVLSPSDEFKSRNELENERKNDDKLVVVKATKKRYFILFMFIILQVVKSFQWICLASITNVVAKFYQVDNLAINWTTILFMVTFLILALPVGWLMDSIGLRRSVLIGSCGITLGMCIKLFSCERTGFALSMFGHLIIGLAEPFFFSSYAQLASVWFPDDQVALATAASLIGEQTGLALGFIVPPLMVGSVSSDFDTIQTGLWRLFASVALISLLNTISIILFFDEQPRHAPGLARLKQLQQHASNSVNVGNTTSQVKYGVRQGVTMTNNNNNNLPSSSNNQHKIHDWQARQRRRLSRRLSHSLSEQAKLSSKYFSNKHFIRLLVGFGINEGTAYSIHTLLNQMIINKSSPAHNDNNDFLLDSPSLLLDTISTNDTTTSLQWSNEDDAMIVGNAGLILIVAGLVGSAVCGWALDRWHKYKLTTCLIYLLAVISMGALTLSLLLESELTLYLASIPLGFALTGYVSSAFDYGVEITYPKPELLSCTLLNISAQIFGIPISLLGSLIVDSYGSQALGFFFCLVLLIGFVINCLQGGELRRQSVVQETIAQRRTHNEQDVTKKADQHTQDVSSQQLVAVHPNHNHRFTTQVPKL